MQTLRLFGTTILALDGEEAMRRTLECMGGVDLALAMEKKLTTSDTKMGLGRLFITDGVVLWGQLSQEEQMKLLIPERYVEVEVVDPRGNRHEMKLRFWPSVKMLALNSGWNKLVRDNNLEAGMDCKLWSFRVGSKLCFALGVERQGHP
ncbi:hypothetical protein PVL29_020203 [Vitis rotundifolia]|uniref:TF-B3 domain-containing protein n=1 Tax=Vitis rotundifolia TaxID=103349 RepID=A0AA38Z2S8_VITRO|nr:hypothetical protein PVL29_020203 [Vitis rotundifolia]